MYNLLAKLDVIFENEEQRLLEIMSSSGKLDLSAEVLNDNSKFDLPSGEMACLESSHNRQQSIASLSIRNDCLEKPELDKPESSPSLEGASDGRFTIDASKMPSKKDKKSTTLVEIVINSPTFQQKDVTKNQPEETKCAHNTLQKVEEKQKIKSSEVTAEKLDHVTVLRQEKKKQRQKCDVLFFVLNLIIVVGQVVSMTAMILACVFLEFYGVNVLIMTGVIVSFLFNFIAITIGIYGICASCFIIPKKYERQQSKKFVLFLDVITVCQIIFLVIPIIIFLIYKININFTSRFVK